MPQTALWNRLCMQDLTMQRDVVEVLASEFVARQRRGECPTIEDMSTRYPSWPMRLSRYSAAIAALEKLKVSQQRMPDGRVSLAGCRLEQLGDFRIIREIGRGGMGIVYETEQVSLSRRVAVKVSAATKHWSILNNCSDLSAKRKRRPDCITLTLSPCLGSDNMTAFITTSCN